MAKSLHWGWLILAYIIGSLFPFTSLVGGITGGKL